MIGATVHQVRNTIINGLLMLPHLPTKRNIICLCVASPKDGAKAGGFCSPYHETNDEHQSFTKHGRCETGSLSWKASTASTLHLPNSRCGSSGDSFSVQREGSGIGSMQGVAIRFGSG